MGIERRIVIQAVLTKEKELIPIWDERFQFQTSDDYGDVITMKGDSSYHYLNVVECIYDLKTRKLSAGIDLDVYPKKDEFEIGEQVYVETNKPYTLREDEVDSIVYEDYDLSIIKGKKANEFYGKMFKDTDFSPEQIYAVKTWKPIYILKNGEKILYSFKLRHKAKVL